MPSIEEARRQQSQQAEVLDAGVSQLSLDQEIEFRSYVRVVLPLDGYVFWQPTDCCKIKGALHHMQEMVQSEDETLGLASVTFTTRERVPEFSDIPINTIYVATFGKFRFALSRQQGFFQANSLWHYQGHSVYPAMASQLLDDPAMLDPTRVVVSNSLPLWLSLNGYVSPFVGGFSNSVMLYPSKAVPANLPPPYGSVHIPPDRTQSLQSVPCVRMIQVLSVDSSGNPILDDHGHEIYIPTRVMDQLMKDTVRIVLYGLQNDEALAFYGTVLEFMRTQPGLGLMNTPSMADGKREQVELQALAMQKVIEIECCYHQYSAKAVALQLIESATVSLLLPS